MPGDDYTVAMGVDGALGGFGVLLLALTWTKRRTRRPHGGVLRA
jgi:hypothetical protein